MRAHRNRCRLYRPARWRRRRGNWGDWPGRARVVIRTPNGAWARGGRRSGGWSNCRGRCRGRGGISRGRGGITRRRQCSTRTRPAVELRRDTLNRLRGPHGSFQLASPEALRELFSTDHRVPVLPPSLQNWSTTAVVYLAPSLFLNATNNILWHVELSDNLDFHTIAVG